MKDHEILQNFLRDLTIENRHTLHLVYALKRSPSAENREQANMQNVQQPFNALFANKAILILFFFYFKADVPVVDDGLRLRNVATSAPSIAAAGLHQPLQQDWVTNGQFPVWANEAGVADPLTQQLLWWQQTYAQQYWAQYMHYLSNGPNPQSTTAPTPAASPVPQVPPPPAVAADVDARPPQPEAQRRPPLAAVGGVAQDEDEEGGLRGARDWLDWIYVASRLAILLGVMYYYSSLSRFVLVTLIVAGIYLYQKAIYQRRDNLANFQANRNANREVNNNAGQGPDPPVEAAAAEGQVAEEPEAALNTDRAEAAAAVTPTAFNVAMNLLIGFFTSLVPEVPAPEALN